MRMHRLIMTILCCCFAIASVAQHPGYKLLPNTDAFRQQFAKASQATNSIQCDFVQEKNLSMLSDKIVSTGKFWFKRENKVRMEYLKPTYYLLVINGNMIKTKDSHKENKVSSKSNKMFEQVNKMMIDCVQGTVLNNSSFTAYIYENPTTYLVELLPVAKSLQGLFKSINLVIDKKDYSALKMEMWEQSGDNTIITFNHKQMNGNIPDEKFSIN